MSLSLVLSFSVQEVNEGRGLGHERFSESLPNRFDSYDKSFDLLGDGGDHKILLTDVIVDLVDIPGTSGSVGLEAGLSELEKFLLSVEGDGDLFLDGSNFRLHDVSPRVNVSLEFLLDRLHKAHCLVKVFMSTISRGCVELCLHSTESVLSQFTFSDVKLSQFGCQLDR